MLGLNNKQIKKLERGQKIQIAKQDAENTRRALNQSLNSAGIRHFNKAIRNGNGLRLDPRIHLGGAIQDYAGYAETGKNFLIDSGLASMALNYGINKASGNKKGKKIASSVSDGLLTGLKSYNLSDTNNMSKNGKKAALTGAFGAYNSYKGKGFLDDVKSAGKSITKTANKTYKKVNKTALKQDWGGKFEAVKGFIPPEVVNESIKLSLIAGGMDSNSASVAAGSATGTLYNVDFSKSLKGQGDEALQGAATGAAQGALMNMAYSGEGFGSQERKKVSKKGSEEMKIKMARLRAMRGNGFKGSSVGGSYSGSGFRDS